MILRVRVIPRSGENEVVGRIGSVLRVKVIAKHSSTDSNNVLINYLAEFFDVPSKMIHIMRGENAREKTVQIKGRPEDELEELMESIP